MKAKPQIKMSVTGLSVSGDDVTQATESLRGIVSELFGLPQYTSVDAQYSKLDMVKAIREYLQWAGKYDQEKDGLVAIKHFVERNVPKAKRITRVKLVSTNLLLQKVF
jgi:hypothetical protein